MMLPDLYITIHVGTFFVVSLFLIGIPFAVGVLFGKAMRRDL